MVILNLLKNFGIDNNKREIFIAKNNQKISDFEFKKSGYTTVRVVPYAATYTKPRVRRCFGVLNILINPQLVF